MRLLCLRAALAIICVSGTAPAYGGEYELKYNAESWQAARAACEAEHAVLASPKTQAEFIELQRLARGTQYGAIQHATSTTRAVWLGVSDLAQCGRWQHVSGEKVEQKDFLIWLNTTHCGPKEPHCAVIDAINPSLRTFWCHYQLPYICEKKT